MISNVTSPVGSVEFCILGLKLDMINQQIILRSAFAKCINMRMFNKNQRSGDRILHPGNRPGIHSAYCL